MKAVEWFQKAADQGLVAAQFNLGIMYENGQGVEKDDERAVEWYQRAADQGHVKAQFNLE
jgi:TPR repeat protein